MWAGAWTRYQAALPFLTRFVTHVCAPGFFLLMGAGLAFAADARARRGLSSPRITRDLAIRGIWLLVVWVPIIVMFAVVAGIVAFLLRRFGVLDRAVRSSPPASAGD